MISDRSAAIMYFQGNPKIFPCRPSLGLRVLCLIRSFWMPSLTQSRTLFLHFRAMPAFLASGNKQIPKRQCRCVGACAPTAPQDIPVLAKGPSTLAFIASPGPDRNRSWKVSALRPQPLCLTPWISSSSLKTSQDFCPGDLFFFCLYGERKECGTS